MPENTPDFEGAPFLNTPYMEEIVKETPVWIENGVLLNVYTEEDSFSVPEVVNRIGTIAFIECRNLKEIIIPDGVSLSTSSFESLKSLERIKLPDTLTEIPDYAFHCCFSLSEIELPESLTKIGKDSFICCESLKSLTFPDSLTDVADDAFSGSDNLIINTEKGSYAEEYAHRNGIMCYCSSEAGGIEEYYHFHKERDHIVIDSLEKNSRGRKNLEIPEEIYGIPVGGIGERLFAEECDILESVKLPESVDTIGAYAFDGCEKLKTIDLTNVSDFIGEYAFRGCKQLNDIILPDKLLNHEGDLFEGCDSLTRIIIPDGAKFAFSPEWYSINTDSLTEIVLPDSLEIIDAESFSRCNSLKAITIPANVNEIRKNAFAEWTVVNVESGSYASQYV